MERRSRPDAHPAIAALWAPLTHPRRCSAQGDGRADLHVHSVWSDGAQHPHAIVRAAAGLVDVIAVTDHDEIRGARQARDFAAQHPDLGVEVVVGEEISTGRTHAGPGAVVVDDGQAPPASPAAVQDLYKFLMLCRRQRQVSLVK